MLSLREPVPISHTQRCPASLLTIALKGTSSHKVRSAMSTMKAVRAHKRGGPEVLRYEDAPVPEVGANEVLVEVNAAARSHAHHPIARILGRDRSGRRRR